MLIPFNPTAIGEVLGDYLNESVHQAAIDPEESRKREYEKEKKKIKEKMKRQEEEENWRKANGGVKSTWLFHHFDIEREYLIFKHWPTY